MIKLPNTVPMPAPEPATPTVAAPAPMNLAAVSMSRETTLVWNSRRVTWSGELLQEGCLGKSSGLLRKEADTGLSRPLVQQRTRAGEMSSDPVACIVSVYRRGEKKAIVTSRAWLFADSATFGRPLRPALPPSTTPFLAPSPREEGIRGQRGSAGSRVLHCLRGGCAQGKPRDRK